MKWTKVDPKTGEPIKKGSNSFFSNDYISGEFRIINNSWMESKNGWILTRNGEEIGRFNTLKEAKMKAEA